MREMQNMTVKYAFADVQAILVVPRMLSEK